MTLSKSMLALGVITASATGVIAASNLVSAHPGIIADEVQSGLVERLAEDTGADAASIEASLKAYRTEMRDQWEAEHEARRLEHLDSLVDKGTITEAQRDALETKMAEMHAAKKELRDQDLTHEEMHEMMQQQREEFEAWATEQGIKLESIRPERGHHGGRHGHHRLDNAMGGGEAESDS